MEFKGKKRTDIILSKSNDKSLRWRSPRQCKSTTNRRQYSEANRSWTLNKLASTLALRFPSRLVYPQRNFWCDDANRYGPFIMTYRRSLTRQMSLLVQDMFTLPENRMLTTQLSMGFMLCTRFWVAFLNHCLPFCHFYFQYWSDWFLLTPSMSLSSFLSSPKM